MSHRSFGPRRGLEASAGILALALGLTGCSSDPGASGKSGTSPSSSSESENPGTTEAPEPEVIEPELSLSVKPEDLAPSQILTLSVENDTSDIDTVKVVGKRQGEHGDYPYIKGKSPEENFLSIQEYDRIKNGRAANSGWTMVRLSNARTLAVDLPLALSSYLRNELS